nr:unnamed protein product [Callosobruchus analis]
MKDRPKKQRMRFEFKKNHKELHLFSDNCWGQSKNHTVIRMLLSLTDCGLFEKIIHYYTVRDIPFFPVTETLLWPKRI